MGINFNDIPDGFVDSDSTENQEQQEIEDMKLKVKNIEENCKLKDRTIEKLEEKISGLINYKNDRFSAEINRRVQFYMNQREADVALEMMKLKNERDEYKEKYNMLCEYFKLNTEDGNAIVNMLNSNKIDTCITERNINRIKGNLNNKEGNLNNKEGNLEHDGGNLNTGIIRHKHSKYKGGNYNKNYSTEKIIILCNKGYTYQQVSNEIGCSLKTVKLRLKKECQKSGGNWTIKES